MVAPGFPPETVAGVTVLVTIGISDWQDHPVRIIQQFRVACVLLDQLTQYVGRHSGTDPFSSVHAYEYDDNSPKERSNGTRSHKTWEACGFDVVENQIGRPSIP